MSVVPMQRRSFSQRRLAALAVSAICAACSDSPTEPSTPSGAVASIAVTALRSTLAPGDTLRLTAQVMDADGRVLPTEPVTWSSSTPSVATVDANGLVTADSVGATTIIATAGGKQSTTDILVLTTVLCECTVILDSTEVTLIARDDSTGTYLFQVIRGPPPRIDVGSILVGAEDGGYIRRVEQVSATGSQIRVETSIAYVEEAVRDGGFSSTSFSDEESGSAQPGGTWWGPWTTTYLDPGVSLTNGLCCSLNDLQLQYTIQPSPNVPAQGSLTFTIKDGDIVFTPRVDIGSTYQNFGLTEFHSIVRGDLELDVRTYEVKLSVAVTKGFEKLVTQSKTFIIQQRPYATFIGPMPVIIIITKKIKLEVTPTVSASATFTGSFRTGLGIWSGVRWQGSWSPVVGATSFLEGTAPVFAGGEGAVSLKVAIVPEFSIEFYGVVGPFVNVEPYGEVVAKTTVSASGGVMTGWDWETGLDFGLNFNVGAKLSLLGRKDLLGFTRTIPIIRPEIRQLHDVIETLSHPVVQLFSDGDLNVRSAVTGEDMPSGFGVELRPAWDPLTGPRDAIIGRNHGTSTQDTVVPANGAVILQDIRSGPGAPHQLRLTDVQGNCSVTNPNPDTLAVNSDLFIAQGGAVQSDTLFQVNCIPLGDLAVGVTATGPHQPSRHSATVTRVDTVGTGKGDTPVTIAIPAGQDTVLEDFIPVNPINGASGLTRVALTPGRRNCAVALPSSKQVVIQSGDTVATGFSVVCVPLGLIRIQAATTDPDPAPSAIQFLPTVTPVAAQDSVESPPGPILAGDSATVAGLVPMYSASGAPGRYGVNLGDSPNRCQESSAFNRSVTVFPGDTAVAAFAVQCVERLHVRTATTGPGTDGNGYLVVIDYADGSADTLATGINQTVAFPGVPAGDHSIRLADVEPTCVAPAGITHTVDARDSTLVGFTVSCPAPPPPSGLNAPLVETNRVDLAWTAPAGMPVALYRVYRNNALHDSSATTGFSDTGLSPFTAFSYQVSSVNSAGLEGARSSALAVRTLDATPPSSPAGLVATPAAPSRINLAWQPASDPETGVARYRIFRDNVLIDSTSTLAYADTGLVSGNTYTYRISAVNGQGLEGGQSAPASATTPLVSQAVDLVIETATSGRAPTAPYSVVVEQGATRLSQVIGPTGTVLFPALAPGDYIITLESVATQCTVTAPNPRTVTLVAGSGSVTAAYQVSCPL